MVSSLPSKIKSSPTYFKSMLLKDLDQVVHGFFTRIGGVSKSPFGTLNASYKRDTYENVKENRTRIFNILKKNDHQDLIGLEQLHSNICHTVTEPPKKTLKGDALVTNIPNLFISVLTADCVPILLADPIHKIIGAAHAGWKGAINGIVSSTVQSMIDLGAQPENIQATLGPCIHQDSYEIGPDLYNQLMQQENIDPYPFLQKHTAKNWLFNLPSFVKELLYQENITAVTNIDLDTYKNDALFFSCRRSAHKNEKGFGVQMSLIALC